MQAITERQGCCEATAPVVFDIEVVTAEGVHDRFQRIGGTSIEHALSAQERAGLGGVVRIRKAPVISPSGERVVGDFSLFDEAL